MREQQYEYDRQHRHERDKKGDRGHGRSITGISRVSTFKGATEEMNGSVFECQDEQQLDRRQYAKTLKESQGYVKKKLKFYQDITPLFVETMTAPAIASRPVAAADMGTTRQRTKSSGTGTEGIRATMLHP